MDDRNVIQEGILLCVQEDGLLVSSEGIITMDRRRQAAGDAEDQAELLEGDSNWAESPDRDRMPLPRRRESRPRKVAPTLIRLINRSVIFA